MGGRWSQTVSFVTLSLPLRKLPVESSVTLLVTLNHLSTLLSEATRGPGEEDRNTVREWLHPACLLKEVTQAMLLPTCDLPVSLINASCSWSHQREHLASFCIAIKTTAGRTSIQRALASSYICLQSSGLAPMVPSDHLQGDQGSIFWLCRASYSA